MQMAKSTFIALTALALLATPLFAGNTTVEKSEAQDTPPPCYSYQLGRDGHWVQLPCKEPGAHAASRHLAPPQGHDEEAH